MGTKMLARLAGIGLIIPIIAVIVLIITIVK